MDSTLIVKAEKISVKYQLSEFKSDSLKEWVLNRIRGRGSRREFTAVDQVSFELRRGESLALVGHNGSGKSTLLRAIAGIIPATGGGRVAVMGRIAPMIELGAGFDGELSGRENIYLSCLLMGLDKAEIDSRIADIIAFSELKEFIESPVKNYSSGMYARLGFACATAVDPDLLIVDEVLAVGDSNFAAKCLRRIEELRHKGVSVILVSHDEATVRRFCDRALVLNRGKMLHDGDIETAYRIQTDIMEARAREAMTPEELQRLMKHQELIQRKADAEGDARLQPVLLVSLNVIQHGVTVTILNLMEPFTFEFAVLIKNGHLFEGDTFFGFEIRTLSGLRICGSGTEPKVIFSSTELKKKASVVVNFRFENGLPVLCGNRIRVCFGVNDCGMTRNLFAAEVLEMEATNPAVGTNEHADILSLKGLVPVITWSNA